MIKVGALKNISTEDISDFQVLVLGWAKHNGRTFPWRRSKESKYRLVVTELLLQRTKAETVRSNYETFFSHFPSWQSLSLAPKSVIEDILKPLGLWKRRAAVLKRLSCIMVARNGRFPLQREEIDLLPGVGQYVGNAIELLCLDRARPLLDSGMARVLERYFGERKLADIRYDPYLQKLSHNVVSHERSKEINWAILDLGALVCINHLPLCEACKLRSNCRVGRNINRHESRNSLNQNRN